MRRIGHAIVFTILLTVQLPVGMSADLKTAYDPSRKSADITTVRSEFKYDNRTVPLKFYLPNSTEAAPVILLSHGLGGSREIGKYLAECWAGKGFVVVAMQHAGSDESVWKGVRLRQRMSAMKKAASAENFMARNGDVKATIDHLQKLNAESQLFKGRFDLSKLGMSGHSFGAVTTQAVSGQSFGPMGKKFTDTRIKAAMLMSPSPPAVGFNKQTFADVTIPWLLMTGTKDSSPIGRNSDPESRREVFQGLPSSGQFYELCLWDALHSAFSDGRDATRSQNRNPNHHAAIQAISTAFWDTYLRQDSKAKQWLLGDGPKKVLETKDSWLKK